MEFGDGAQRIPPFESVASSVVTSPGSKKWYATAHRGDDDDDNDSLYGDGDPGFYMGPLTMRDLFSMNRMLYDYLAGEYSKYLPGHGDLDTVVAKGCFKNIRCDDPQDPFVSIKQTAARRRDILRR